MSKVRRVDFSPDEWLAGTRALTPEERGLYWDCCALIYSRGGPIADDEEWLKKALACDVRTWRRVRARLLEARKLEVLEIDGQPHLMNGRAGREIEAAGDRIDTASRGGRAKAAKAAQNQDRPNFGENSARILREVPAKTGPFSSEINGLGPAIINHQPSTTIIGESLTVERGAPRARRAASPTPRERVNAHWELNPELRAWTTDTLAATHAGDRVSIDTELRKFRTYHGRKGTAARDADAAWHTWIFNAIEWSEKHGTNRQSGGQPRKHTNAQRAAAFLAGLGRSRDS